MATVIRGATPYLWRNKAAASAGKKFPPTTDVEFSEFPVSKEVAKSHLAVAAPDGAVIICHGRGKKGGWGTLYFTHKALPSDYRLRQGATLHLVVRMKK